jgi:hypothetical protein
MSFSKEFFKNITQDLISPFHYSVMLINGTAVYVDGFEKILSLALDEIVLKTKKQRLKINGENLEIEKLEEFSCVITGCIRGFYVE